MNGFVCVTMRHSKEISNVTLIIIPVKFISLLHDILTKLTQTFGNSFFSLLSHNKDKFSVHKHH